jgi:cytochrome c oxidase subunit 4
MSADSTQVSRAAAEIWRSCLWVWGALLLLVLLSLGLAHVPLGRFNLPAAFLIAATQALLIGVLFMELRIAKSLIRLAAAAAFVWIAVMFLLTFNDLITRGG